MKRNTKKGNITVEAAIVLPVFILTVVSVGYFINYAVCKDDVFHGMTDEANKIAAYAYVVRVPAGIKSRMEERVGKESALLDGYSVTDADYMFGDGRISIRSEGMIINRMPLQVKDSITFDCNIMFRGFVPKDNSSDIFSFDEMEISSDGGTVWVFPVAGERYHDHDCPYIEVDARQVLLTEEIMSRYTPCEICRPDEAAKGSLVYCFPSAGEVYHTGSCSMVDRYVVSMSRYEAESKGYTPCMKCGGGI